MSRSPILWCAIPPRVQSQVVPVRYLAVERAIRRPPEPRLPVLPRHEPTRPSGAQPRTTCTHYDPAYFKSLNKNYASGIQDTHYSLNDISLAGFSTLAAQVLAEVSADALTQLQNS